MMRFASVVCVLTIAATWSMDPAFAQSAAVAPLSYSQPLAPNSVRLVQEKLASVGAYQGQADGVWGPDSASALTNFNRPIACSRPAS